MFNQLERNGIFKTFPPPAGYYNFIYAYMEMLY